MTTPLPVGPAPRGVPPRPGEVGPGPARGGMRNLPRPARADERRGGPVPPVRLPRHGRRRRRRRGSPAAPGLVRPSCRSRRPAPPPLLFLVKPVAPEGLLAAKGEVLSLEVFAETAEGARQLANGELLADGAPLRIQVETTVPCRVRRSRRRLRGARHGAATRPGRGEPLVSGTAVLPARRSCRATRVRNGSTPSAAASPCRCSRSRSRSPTRPPATTIAFAGRTGSPACRRERSRPPCSSSTARRSPGHDEHEGRGRAARQVAPQEGRQNPSARRWTMACPALGSARRPWPPLLAAETPTRRRRTRSAPKGVRAEAGRRRHLGAGIGPEMEAVRVAMDALPIGVVFAECIPGQAPAIVEPQRRLRPDRRA